MTEILVNAAGEPYLFVAERGELQQAIDEIPAETLIRANRAAWTSRGVVPPKTAAISAPPAASCAIGSSRASMPSMCASCPAAGPGFVFPPPARRWSLVVERSDPRILDAMARARVQPGDSFEWQIMGSDRAQTYRRRADGDCWTERW